MTTARPRLVFIAVVLLSLAAPLATPAVAQDATPAASEEVTILGPDEEYAGVDRGEWDARSWQWSVSMPEAVSPSFDPTGERCGYGQSGPVFYLPGNFTTEPNNQVCVVPEGTAIFVTLGGFGCSTVEPPPYFGRNEEELRACATAGADSITELQASINGQEIPDLENYRASTPLFTVNFPVDNFYAVQEGVALSVAEGYSLIVAPPPPGEYEIEVSTSFEGEAFASTITVVVEAPQVIEPAATPGATPMATPAG